MLQTPWNVLENRYGFRSSLLLWGKKSLFLLEDRDVFNWIVQLSWPFQLNISVRWQMQLVYNSNLDNPWAAWSMTTLKLKAGSHGNNTFEWALRYWRNILFEKCSIALRLLEYVVPSSFWLFLIVIRYTVYHTNTTHWVLQRYNIFIIYFFVIFIGTFII